jgi:L-asparaginase II
MTDRRALVRVVRNGLQESEHEVHVAVADERGRLVGRAGDPARRVFARSSMKPIQAAVSLSQMGDETARTLTDRHVALMCASHNGESVHVRVVRGLLAVAGLNESALRNPPGWPLDREAARRAREPSRIRHNCSGKHAGMVVATASAGWRLETYLRPSHPLQRRVLAAVRSSSGLEAIDVGVDGCGVPVFGMPLSALATIFARLARPGRLGELEPHASRGVAAMRAHPYLVAGRKREDSAIMQAVPGLVVKTGAEAVICAADAASGLGVAVKVADGGERAAPPALLRALELLGAVSSSHMRELDRFARPWVTGGGSRVGELVADVRLSTR